ncbi:uncharacterized protein [Macrobrachium rosenbergii]
MIAFSLLITTALVVVLLNKTGKRFQCLSTKEPFEVLLTSTMAAYSETDLMSFSACKFTEKVEPKLWDVVAKNDVEQAQSLLLQGADPFEMEEDQQTTAYIEAHLLGYKEISQILSRLQENPEVTHEGNLIKSIIMELRIRERKIFSAARNGRYGSYNGVKLLLEAYSLPATIYNQQRHSLIHYIASASFTNGVPAWDAKDIHEFFSNHEYYINAVDLEGNTALHKLASRQAVNGNDGALYIWNGKRLSLEDIWISMAETFLDHDCDPRIKNHCGILAQELAAEYGHHELAKLLKKKCDSLGKVDYSVTADRFSEMVDAVRRGETTKIIDLLKSGVPLLPINAHADPLVEAIRCNQRDTVILLVGAGAPLGNQSIGDITPLEAAHTTVDLPAVIPALIRKVLGDMLREEGLRIGIKDEMAEFRNEVVNAGCEARWKFERDAKEKNVEARELLLQAAEQGCYTFCQMLSQEDVHLHSMCREENAFRKAVENNQVHTQLTLCRDLKMSPLTFTLSALESLNRDLGTSILIGQIRILKDACKNPSNPFLQGKQGMAIDQCINDLQRFCDTNYSQHTEIGEPLDTLLYTVAKEGLDAIMYVLMTKCKSFDINKEIDFSKSTLLHVAAMNGQINMIEFLLFHEAKLDLVTVGGYTAAHLAALGGHKEAFLYIEEHMQKNDINVDAKCQVGLTASELMANYSTVCGSLTLPLTSHEDALTVMNEKTNSEKAYEILRRKGEALNITKPQALFECVEKNAFSGEDMIYISTTVREEVGEICNALKKSDFGGILSLMGPLQEDTEIFNVSDVHFTLELEAFHCMDHTAPVTYEEAANRNHTTFILRHNSKPDLFKGTNFIQEFSKAMEAALLSYKSSPDKISLCSPFLTTGLSEVSFCLLLKKDENFIKIAVHVLPIIAISSPKESRIKEGYEEYIKSNNGNAQICLFNSEGEWLFHPHHFEKYMFQNLNESQRKVRRACHLISKLLNPWTWAPPFSAKHFIKPWHTLSVGVDFLQPEAVNSLFLRECTKNSSPWTEDRIFQKLLSLYQHAAEKDPQGTWTVQKNIESSVFLRVYYENNDSVCGVLRYLEYLQSNNNSC